MLTLLKNLISKFFNTVFKSKKKIKLGLYGPPNGGKTTLANLICVDWINQEMGAVSNIAHETREIQTKEEIKIKSKNGKEIIFDLVDTPGIATKIDYEDFLKHGISESESKERARQATRGVIESIKWIENIDVVLVVLDSTLDPYSQVNITIIGNLAARKIPLLIVANKIDLKKSHVDKIHAAFPQYEVVGISAKYRKNIDEFYEELFDIMEKNH
jgi:GTPase